MSTKFIAAKDLPVAEGNEVDVLCVENGALKRKEGASFGGGGNSNNFDSPFVAITVTEHADGSFTSDFDYDAVNELFCAGKIMFVRVYDEELDTFGLRPTMFYAYKTMPSDWDWCVFKSAGDYMGGAYTQCVFSSDGTIHVSFVNNN